MPFTLVYSSTAHQQFNELSHDQSRQKQFKAVLKALGFLANDPTYPSLNTHKFSSLKGPADAEVFEAYAENNTPGAYRIFWCYYPPKQDKDPQGFITVLFITPHP